MAFFITYTLHKRESTHRLEVAHTKLQQAYDKLEETTAAKERIESELRIARDIQMSMVPNIFPNHEGLDMHASMSPAKEVGGDLYGYLLMGDNLYFALGDVSGKGVPASLFMAQATRLFRTLATQGMMPAEICTRMNDALSGEDNQSGMFVTFFLGLLNLKTGNLHYCNAGHNPPIIGGGEHHGDFLEVLPNAPIGLWPGLEYQGEELESVRKRPLFIYTDGLNEAEDTEQNQFGDDRLLDILRHTHFDSAKQVIETLQAAVEQHRNGAEPNDDLTMMCIRIS
jgi:sigma-B regulation protein RsbU (phosphoserine phosphatase)